MHYYNFNIGDYVSHTRHLTPIEDICYRRALDFYYLHEKPLISDINLLSRLLLLKGYEGELKNVMDEFFELTNDGYTNSRADAEIKQFRGFAEHGKRGAEKRWKGKSNDSPPNSPPNGEGISLPIDPLKGGNGEVYETLIATNNHKPITNNQLNNPLTTFEGMSPPEKKKKPDPETIPPYKEIKNLYNEICGEAGLAKCSTISDARKRNLNARWNSKNSKGEYSRRSLDWWRKFFELVAASDFLTGRVKTQDRNWKADFDFCVTESSFVKICEGKYNNGAS